jgi:hypothetical protein
MKGARSAKRTPWSRVKDRLDAHNVRVAADIFQPARGEQNACAPKPSGSGRIRIGANNVLSAGRG